VESVGGGGITAFGVAVSAGRVFWTAEADGGVILSANLQGGEVRTVAEGQRFPVSLSWQNDALVWANYVADGGVQRARELPDGGWRWETLVKDQPTPWFAVDRPEALFWTVTQAPGAVYMCPSGGCNGPPQTLVGGLVRPTFLAVDEKAVYVASQDGRVLKVAR
jgi:hypothetical protein